MMYTTTCQQLIKIPGAPDIEGLNFRRFSGEADFHYMAEILNLCSTYDQLDGFYTAEGFASYYRHLVNTNLYKDVLIAEMNNRPIAFCWTSWHNEESQIRIYEHYGHVIPKWRRKGIGRALLRFNQRRLKSISRNHQEGKQRWFETYAEDTEIAAVKLIESEGYTPVRYFYTMVRNDLENIPNLPLPKGIEVRPVEPDHYQAINDASREAFRDHWGYSDELNPSVAQWLDDPNFDPALWRVAWDGDQIAGMVLSYIDVKENQNLKRLRGYTENICVRRPWRNQGVAKALIALSLNAIKERGMTEAALGVDTQNTSGALRLYESAGFKPTKLSTLYRLRF